MDRPEAPPAVLVEGLSRRYGDGERAVQALDDVTLTVSARATGLLGANGAGKSTLMRMLLGVDRPDRGRVRVLGVDLARDPAGVRRRVGWMPEHPCLPSDLSAQEMCVLTARLRGLSRRDARRRASEVLFAVGLAEERRRPVDTYSLGMRQRATLAQALVHGPELVVLDEPTSGLDPAGRAEMLTVVRRLSADLGVRVLLSSHVLDDVERTCDEVVVLAAGRVVARRAVLTGGPRPVVLRVDGDLAGVAADLSARGVDVAPSGDGGAVLARPDDATLTAVRDVVAARGVAVLRLAPEGDALEEAVVGAMESRR